MTEHVWRCRQAATVIQLYSQYWWHQYIFRAQTHAHFNLCCTRLKETSIFFNLSRVYLSLRLQIRYMSFFKIKDFFFVLLTPFKMILMTSDNDNYNCLVLWSRCLQYPDCIHICFIHHFTDIVLQTCGSFTLGICSMLPDPRNNIKTQKNVYCKII